MARPVRALLLLLALLLAGPAWAQTFPKFTGFVVDGADVLPPAQEAALTAKLDALQKATGRQLVVATVPGLQGYTIEDYGYRLGRAWRVGLKGLDNGAILLVAPVERKVRVEVGYGLTPVLTDVYSTLLIQNRILPAFKAGDLPGGIAAGADALIEQLSLPDPEAKARLDAAVAEHDAAREGGGGFPLGLIFWGIVAAFVILSMLRSGGGGGGGGGRRFRGGRGVAPVILGGPGLGGGGFGGGGGSAGGCGGRVGAGVGGGGCRSVVG
ncbi:TPM domain-containing protein, partial [Sphingomonas solaris]